MILIAHRGNIRGPSQAENNPGYVQRAIESGYDAEIDVWLTDKGWFLGHDKPFYEITLDWLYEYENKLWCHAKNLKALEMLISQYIHCFWHDNDKYTVTSKGYIWAYPNEKTHPSRTIAVLPEQKQTLVNIETCCGICSDYIERYK